VDFLIREKPILQSRHFDYEKADMVKEVPVIQNKRMAFTNVKYD
jgi:hypothetical protein